MKKPVSTCCPCRISSSSSSNQSLFSECCQPFLETAALPETAEQLMRSRYTAYVLENKAYLLSSWHPQTRPENMDFDTHTKWLGLKIKHKKAGQAADKKGWVDFVARYRIGGKAERIEELSYFLKENNAWQYFAAVETME